MKRNLLRSVVSILVLGATIGLFIYYLVRHPAVRRQLHNLSPATLGLILGLYVIGIIALMLVTLSTLRLCRVRLKTSEGLLITAYSSVINFFLPLQSGPAFRAVYLKKKHGLNLKDYAVATLVYYFFYGSFSLVMLLSGLLKWWLALGAIVLLAAAVMAQKNRRWSDRLRRLDLRGWYYLALATLLQVVVVTVIYYTELHSLAPLTRVSQAIIYSGAANLALFVSLTPGAIGFRESFLLFSQRLHHISSDTIVAANVIDRSVYILLLGLLALFIFGSKARKLLNIKT